MKGVYPWLPPQHLLLLLILPVGLTLTLFPDHLWQRRQKYFMIMMLLKRMSSLCLLMRSVTADLGVSSKFFLYLNWLWNIHHLKQESLFSSSKNKAISFRSNFPKTTVKATGILICTVLILKTTMPRLLITKDWYDLPPASNHFLSIHRDKWNPVARTCSPFLPPGGWYGRSSQQLAVVHELI